MHPLYKEYLRILDEVLPVYDNVLQYQHDENVVRIFLTEFMGINPTVPPEEKSQAIYSYRKKIKGYHLAFNVHDPIAASHLSKYKFQPKKNELSAEQIKKKLAENRQKRDEAKRQQERLANEKYQKDREALRKMHEKLRKQKMEELMNQGSHSENIR